MYELQKARQSDAALPDVNATLDKIRSTIDNFSKLKKSEAEIALKSIVAKFIISWFIVKCINFLVDIFSTVLTFTFMPVYLLARKLVKWYSIDNFSRIVSTIIPSIIYAIPTFFRIYLLFIVIFSAAQPLAHQASIILGASTPYEQMTRSVKELNVEGFIKSLAVIFAY